MKKILNFINYILGYRNGFVFFTVLVYVLTDLHGIDILYCDYCENKIADNQKYLSFRDKNFCSQKCFESTLPECSVCGGISLKTVIFDFGDEELVYCTGCADLPLCYSCGIPRADIDYRKGDHICEQCKKRSAGSVNASMNLIRDVRNLMKDSLDIRTDNYISFEFTDVQKIKQISTKENMELGLYLHKNKKKTTVRSKIVNGFEYGKRTETTETDSFYIYILDDLPKEKLIETAAHELAHDWMELNYPEIDDLEIIEGWAVFISYLINEQYGQIYLNKIIEQKRNDVYSRGYHRIRSIFDKEGFYGLYEYFASINK